MVRTFMDAGLTRAMYSSLSVIIPAHNSAAMLERSLRALRGGTIQPDEILVVDDCSTDDTAETARRAGVTVLSTGRRSGPARARNLAAAQASGTLLLFLDSDVCVHADTLARFHKIFEQDDVDAVMGSYDNNPASQDFISQYRNLMHAYVHQQGALRASTFWSGCGAIRRDIFLKHSGFSSDYGRPAIEDIELGYRLTRAGRKILLDRSILVTHLKRWTFWNLIKTDIFDRGIPWTELILRERFMPNDLNLQLSQRVSVALVFLQVGIAIAFALKMGAYFLLPALVIVFCMLARWWGLRGSYRRPRYALGRLTLVVAVIASLAYAFHMRGLIAPLVAIPALLAIRHRYARKGKMRRIYRIAGLLFIAASVGIAVYYMPAHPLVYAAFVVLALLGWANSQFYVFLAGNRGLPFMLAAIPFHLLYHFYSGLSFLAGATLHSWNLAFGKRGSTDRDTRGA